MVFKQKYSLVLLYYFFFLYCYTGYTPSYWTSAFSCFKSHLQQTSADSEWLKDARKWTHGKVKFNKVEAKYLFKSAALPSRVLSPPFAEKRTTESPRCCPEDLLKHIEQIHRIQIKRWQFTGFIQLLYSTNIRTITLLWAHCL